jgi:putative flavoprotein involved in K+ transport
VTRLQVAVVGGGQAGLAMGQALTRRGLRGGEDFVILDAADQAGAAWRDRWDSLRLFTPARFSALPGMAFPGPPDAYPGKDDVAAYLAAYTARFDLPVRHRTPVRRLTQDPAGPGFVLTTAHGPVRAGAVVVATGPFQVPAVPAIATHLGPQVDQLHSADYRNPAQLPLGPVLVVGAGNSGVQIAADLAATHDVTLAVETSLPHLPQRIAGQDIFTWLTRTRIMNLTVDSRLGRRLSRRGEVLVGTRLHDLTALGVNLVDRVTAADTHTVTTHDHARLDVTTIIWATGYRPDFTWLPTASLDQHGRPRHHRGLTPIPGLAVLGLPWLHTRGSALLGWVGHDAGWLADHLLPPGSELPAGMRGSARPRLRPREEGEDAPAPLVSSAGEEPGARY